MSENRHLQKVLIYYKESQLKPIGGPAGYLFCLSRGLECVATEDFEFHFLGGGETCERMKESLKKTSNPILQLMRKAYQQLKHIKKNLSARSLEQDISGYLSFDIIHFHRTTDLYQCRRQLEDYRGLVVLSSHSPQPLSSEMIEGSSAWEMRLFGRRYGALEEIDRYAFERADYLFFPVETADEPYVNAWPVYSEIKERKFNKYRYVPTGTVDVEARLDRQCVRRNLGIPESAFVICYVGRHNRVKGYDRLVSICEKTLEEYPDAYVVVAGAEGPLKAPSCDRWLELGWQDDPHSLIAASDVFVLPNRETYFDLILLECLSLGTPVVASNTGGNKYFQQYSHLGLQLFDMEIECRSEIDRLRSANYKDIAVARQRNRELYQQNFSIEQFAYNYIEALKTIN